MSLYKAADVLEQINLKELQIEAVHLSKKKQW